MKRASISQTKNNLSAYIDMVRKGETVVITDRDRPVARLEPVLANDMSDSSEALSKLEREGLIKLSQKKPSAKILSAIPLAKASKGASIVKALLADREEGR